MCCTGRHLRSRLKCGTVLPPCTTWAASLRRSSGGVLLCGRAPTGGQQYALAQSADQVGAWGAPDLLEACNIAHLQEKNVQAQV